MLKYLRNVLIVASSMMIPLCAADTAARHKVQYEAWGGEFRESLLKNPATPWWSRMWMNYFPARINVLTKTPEQMYGIHAHNIFNRITLAHSPDSTESYRKRLLAHEYIHYAYCHNIRRLTRVFSTLFAVYGVTRPLVYESIKLATGKPVSVGCNYYLEKLFLLGYLALVCKVISNHAYELEAESLSSICFDISRGEILREIIRGNMDLPQRSYRDSIFAKLLYHVMKYPTQQEFLRATFQTALLAYSEERYKNDCLSRLLVDDSQLRADALAVARQKIRSAINDATESVSSKDQQELMSRLYGYLDDVVT